MSARIYSIWDWDGSLSGMNEPTLIGSYLNWWDESNGMYVYMSQKYRVLFFCLVLVFFLLFFWAKGFIL